MKRFFSLPLVAFSTACAGVFVEGGVSFGAGGGLAVSVGANLDWDRQGRGAVGYETGTGGAAAAVRADYHLAALTDDLFVGAGAGAALGEAGGGSYVFGGPEAAWYLSPRQSVHLALGPRLSSAGAGGVARIAYVFSFGDTRPDSYLMIPFQTRANLMPKLRTTAEARGCQARDAADSEGGTLRVMCPPDERHMLVHQTVDVITVKCEHRPEKECRAWFDGMVRETNERIKDAQK